MATLYHSFYIISYIVDPKYSHLVVNMDIFPTISAGCERNSSFAGSPAAIVAQANRSIHARIGWKPQIRICAGRSKCCWDLGENEGQWGKFWD